MWKIIFILFLSSLVLIPTASAFCGNAICEAGEDKLNCHDDCGLVSIEIDEGRDEVTFPVAKNSSLVCGTRKDGCTFLLKNQENVPIVFTVSIVQIEDESFRWAYLYNGEVKTSEMEVLIQPQESKEIAYGAAVPSNVEGKRYSFDILIRTSPELGTYTVNLDVGIWDFMLPILNLLLGSVDLGDNIGEVPNIYILVGGLGIIMGSAYLISRSGGGRRF